MTKNKALKKADDEPKGVFIEQYKLERNPFAEEAVRPLYVSQSMRVVSGRLLRLAQGVIQSLYISGVAGVGKTTLISQRARAFKDVDVVWITPDIDTPEALFDKLLRQLGLGAIDGTRNEMRGIVEVYLKHQAAKGQFAVIIADGVERQSHEVLNALESICALRIKGKPILRTVLLTRNEDLVDDLMAQKESSAGGKSLHGRLSGFTLEETGTYIRACLQGAGCDWAHELIPDSVVFDIQAYTQGVIGDLNRLCCEALNEIAAAAEDGSERRRVTKTLLKEVASRLNLRYDSHAWAQTQDEKLSPEAVKVTEHWGLQINAARLVVSSEGQQIAEIKLNRPRMVLGRDSGCDISLESNYLSRYQNLFMETDDGWMIIDLNSTNGCFVNGRRVHQHRLKDGDRIAVGQHQLHFTDGGRIEQVASNEGGDKPASSTTDPTEETLIADLGKQNMQLRAGPKQASKE